MGKMYEQELHLWTSSGKDVRTNELDLWTSSGKDVRTRVRFVDIP